MILSASVGQFSIICKPPPNRETFRPFPPRLRKKELEKEEADLYRSKDDILQQSQRLTASFLEQKGELEGSARHAQERARTAEAELAAIQEELDAARYNDF